MGERSGELGLRCSVCGGPVTVREFGREGLGVWVGCLRSRECVRHVLVRVRGWSRAEVVREWRRRNTGVWKYVGRVKRWFRERWGKEVRAERKRAEQKRERELELLAERERVFYGKRSQEGAQKRC